MPRLARPRRTSRPSAARKPAAARPLDWLSGAGFRHVLDFLLSRTASNLMHYSSYEHSAGWSVRQGTALLENLAPAGLLVGRYFAFLCGVGSRIVGRVHERNHRLGFHRRRRQMAARGFGSDDGILLPG